MAKGKKLTPRRLAREWALQFLFQHDVRQAEFEEEDLELFWEQLQLSPSLPKEKAFETGREYADKLIRGVLADVSEYDELLRKFSTNWTLERMAAVDRNILRMGLFEIQNTDVPVEVVIDEAVEIAKAFADKDSSSFINAILDKVSKQID